MTDLVARLRALARAEHDDLSVGAEAADELTRLTARLAEREGEVERLQSDIQLMASPHESVGHIVLEYRHRAEQAEAALAEREATVDILVARVHERDAELAEVKRTSKTEVRFTNDYIKRLHEAEAALAQEREAHAVTQGNRDRLLGRIEAERYWVEQAGLTRDKALADLRAEREAHALTAERYVASNRELKAERAKGE